jgi:pimeloyl-ACP methyl ester carboxylesterase
MTDADRTDARAPDGTRLAVYEWGDPKGPEILLVHGIAQCHLCFRPQYRSALAERYRIVAYDQRGHGESEQPTDPAAYQGNRVWADDLAAVLAAKRLERPVVVGWSMGGRVTRQYLMVYGDAAIAGINFVSSLVIEDPSWCGPEGPKRPLEGQTLEEEIEAAIAFVEGCYARKPDEAEFRRVLAYNIRVPAAVRRAISGWSTDLEATIAALARVRVPTLITHGRRDSVVLPGAAEATRSVAEATRSAIPHARLSWFDECGHSPFAEDAARFNADLAGFIQSCQRSR